MPAAKNVLIVGGGIAGLTLAYALERAGIRARIIEAGKRTDRLGVGISLLGNALRALDAIGLADVCLARGTGFDVVTNRDAASRLFNVAPIPGKFGKDRPAACGIMRTVLGDLLEDAALGAGASIDYSTTVRQIEQDQRGVTATLSTGEIVRSDLLVAADGVYSKTRAAVFGADLKPEYCGQGGWRYTAPRSEEIDGIVFYRADSGRVLGCIPISATTCYYFLLEDLPRSTHLPEEDLGRLFRERMEPFTSAPLVAARDLIGPDSYVSYRPFDIMLAPAPWHRGRVVLVGDAAHSLTPQLTSGGGMAIEDAVVLAEELRQASDLGEGLEAYSRRRFERVRSVYETSLAICRNEQNSQPDGEVSMGLLRRGHELLAAPF